MKSNSIYYDDNYNSYDKKENKVDTHTILKCSCPNSITIPAGSDVGTTFSPISLTINTSCIKNPITRIDFVSNIVSEGFHATVSFQVFKQCKYQSTPIPVGPAYNFGMLMQSSYYNTFSFFVCDRDSCDDDCCTYTVVITVLRAVEGDIAINNATLSSITTNSANSCY